MLTLLRCRLHSCMSVGVWRYLGTTTKKSCTFLFALLSQKEENMKKLLLLLMTVLMPMGMMAEGEYPNALMVSLNNGSIVGFQLEGTTLQMLPSTNQVKVSTEKDNQAFILSDVKSIAYEHHDLNTLGIDVVSMNGIADIEVYTLDGRKVAAERVSLGNAVRGLSKGIYVIKVNGRTLKISK